MFECSSSSDRSLNPQGPHRIHLADASATRVHPTHAAARVPATHRDSRPAAWGGLAGGRRGARACVGVVAGGPGLPRLAGSTAQVASLSSSSRSSSSSSSTSGKHSSIRGRAEEVERVILGGRGRTRRRRARARPPAAARGGLRADFFFLVFYSVCSGG